MYNPEQHNIRLQKTVAAATNDKTLCGLLPDLLITLHWKGSASELASVLHSHSTDGPGSCHLILLSLGYSLEETKITSQTIDGPALLKQGDRILLILSADQDMLTVNDGETITQIPRPSLFRIFRIAELADHSATIRSWSRSSLQLFWPKILAALVVSSILGVLALVIPLFTRHVYDMAIPSKSVNTLTHLGLGALLAIFYLFGFSLLRVRIVAATCQSWTYKLALSYGKKIYHLPFVQGLGQPFQGTFNRFKDIDHLRQFFISRSGLSLLDIPFLSISLITIYFIGGWLVVVPIVSIVTYALVLPPFHSIIAHAATLSAHALREKNNLELDLARHAQDIGAQGLKDAWLKRYQTVNMETVKAARSQAKLSQLMQHTTYIITQFTSLATMALGIYLVMDMKLTAGDLIAAMMLARRITAPIQSSAMSLSRLAKFKTTLSQIDRFHTIEDEKAQAETIFPIAEQPIAFDNVVFRYGNAADPALAGVSFQTEANQIVAIAGPNNSGKSALINILSKCIHAQSGKVLIGKNNVKNMAADHYRDQIAYAGEWLPQGPDSILAYLGKLNPSCHETEITSLCQEHGFTDALMQCDLGLQSPLADCQDPYIHHYLSFMHLIVKDVPLVLMDMNFNAKHDREEELLNKFLNIIRGKKTVFYTTLRAELMQTADVALVLDQGSVAHFGPMGTKAEVLT